MNAAKPAWMMQARTAGLMAPTPRDMHNFRQDMMKLDIPLAPKLLGPGEGASMWERHDSYIFECADFGPAPGFYPVYRHKNLYSFSILPLIAAKGGLSLNADFVA
jgi:hypothetical protein